MSSTDDITPRDHFAELQYLGHDEDRIKPPLTEDNWWDAGTVHAERDNLKDSDWTFSNEQMKRDVDPFMGGFWLWGDVLIYVRPDTLLESTLEIWRRKEKLP